MPRPRSWTDEQLADAVKTSTTWREVCAAIGVRGGGHYTLVRVRAAEMQLDYRHIDDRERALRASRSRDQRPKRAGNRDRRTWTDDDLQRAVAVSASLNAAFHELGLSVGGSQWIIVRDRIRELGLDTSHWRPTRRRWTDEQLVAAVEASTSYAGVLRHLSISGGSSTATIKRRVVDLGLDTSHMKGQGWLRGVTNPGIRPKRPLSEILVQDSSRLDTHAIKLRLLDEGLKDHRCEVCRSTEWNRQPIPLHLDHINGDRRDNRFENLRLLCPNCHAQTDTYCGRNIGRYDREEHA